MLATYLAAIGFTSSEVGLVVTATMLGSAALSLVVGLRAHRHSRRRLLRVLSLLMVATGLAFAGFTTFWALVLVALVGTLNPGGNDISAFQPTEQAALPDTVDDRHRTAIFARYGLIGILVAAVGAGLAGAPGWVAEQMSVDHVDALRWCFLVYAVLGAVAFRLYASLSERVEHRPQATSKPLGPSRRTVCRHRLKTDPLSPAEN